MNTPFRNCYWVQPGRFLAGGYPTFGDDGEPGRNIRKLLEIGISVFIDLTEEGELPSYTGFIGKATHERFPIANLSLPGTDEEMVRILDAIDRHLNEDRRV